MTDVHLKDAKEDWCDSCLNKCDKNCAVCAFAPWNVEAIMNAFGNRVNEQGVTAALTDSPAMQRLLNAPKFQTMAELMQRAQPRVIFRPKTPNIIVPSANHIAAVARKHGMM
jgi:hypothetical protein